MPTESIERFFESNMLVDLADLENSSLGPPGFRFNMVIEKILSAGLDPGDFYYRPITEGQGLFSFYKGFVLIESPDIDEAMFSAIKEKMKILNKTVASRDFSSFFRLIDERLKIELMIEVFNFIPDVDKYPLFVEVAATVKGGQEAFPVDFIQRVRRYKGALPNRPLADENQMVVIYRGQNSDSLSLDRGHSWTTDINIAVSYALDGPEPGCVFRALVHIDDILDYVTSQREKEIVLMPARLREVCRVDLLTLGALSATLDGAGVVASYMEYSASIERAWFHNPDGIHAVTHTRRVLFLALAIAFMEMMNEADTRIMREAAMYHDIGRTTDGYDSVHGMQSFKQAIDQGLIKDLGMEDMEILRFVMENHSAPDMAVYKVIKQYHFQDVERGLRLYHAFKDADGLDRVRIRDLNPEYLRTASAARLIMAAHQLFKAGEFEKFEDSFFLSREDEELGEASLVVHHLLSEKYAQDILNMPEKRPGFVKDENKTELPVVFARVIGIDDESAYVNRVYDLDEKLRASGFPYVLIEAGLPKNVPLEWSKSFTEQWAIIAPMRSPKASDIIEIFLRSGLLGTFEEEHRRQLKSALSTCLGMFVDKTASRDIVKNFLIKLLYWTQSYFLDRLHFYRPGQANPRVLFWGGPSRDEVYFLLNLTFLGCDLIGFDPAEDGKWADVPGIEEYAFIQKHAKRAKLPQFPTSPRGRQEETVAYRAEQEIQQMLHNAETGVFSPWQLESFYPVPVTLTTTLDEMMILWKAEARFRPGFEVRNNNVLLPAIFAKVTGVDHDLDDYADRIRAMRNPGAFCREFHSWPLCEVNMRINDRALMDAGGRFIPEKLSGMQNYPLARLRPAMQKNIIAKLNELITSSSYMNIIWDNNTKYLALNAVLSLDRGYQDMLQQFDFPFGVPKLMIFNSGESDPSLNDALILAFLHIMGVDIVLFNPGAYADIESYFPEGYFQIQRLEQVRFDVKANIIERRPRKGLFDWLRH